MKSNDISMKSNFNVDSIADLRRFVCELRARLEGFKEDAHAVLRGTAYSDNRVIESNSHLVESILGWMDAYEG